MDLLKLVLKRGLKSPDIRIFNAHHFATLVTFAPRLRLIIWLGSNLGLLDRHDKVVELKRSYKKDR